MGEQCIEESPHFLGVPGLGTRVKNLFLKNRFFRRTERRNHQDFSSTEADPSGQARGA